MMELFTHKQIRCEHCGFEFAIIGFGSAAKIVCLACGEENVLPPPPKPVVPPDPIEHKSEFPELLTRRPMATETLLCSVEQCPLLTESEAGSAIAEQVKLRLRKKKQRRRNILAWTVTLQICVLLGVALFVMRTLLVPDGSLTTQPIAHVEIESDTESTNMMFSPPTHVTHLPENVEPFSAASEGMMAWNNFPDNVPFATVDGTEHAVSPFETAHDFFQAPPFDSLISAPDMLAEASESLPAPLPLVEPMTLEMANNLLETAKTTLATVPEDSVRQAIQAATIYEQLGQPYPDSLYWILGNAFASLSWGEPLLESSPAIETMTLSADNRYLLAQLKDKKVWLWDLQSPESMRSGYPLDQGTTEYVKFVFSPDLRWIIGGQKNGTIRIWDMELKNPANMDVMFAERVPGLQDLQISPNGQWLAAFGNSPQGVSFSGTLQPRQPIQQASYRRPDRFGASDSSPYPILLWNLRQMEAGIVPMATQVPSTPHPAQVVRFSPNSDRLAVGRQDAVVRVYDLAAHGVGNDPFILRGHQLGITQIVFAPCGQWVATGSQDNTVRLWNLTSSKLSPESTALFGHIGWISALTIDQTGEYILSGSYDRTIRIWNVKRGRIATALNEHPIVLKTNLGVPEFLAVTQDGDKMIVQGNEGSLGIYHFPSLLGDAPEDYFRAVTFRNSRLSISKSLLTTDDQLLIFSYEHLSNPSNNGIRLWALQTQPFVR